MFSARRLSKPAAEAISNKASHYDKPIATVFAAYGAGLLAIFCHNEKEKSRAAKQGEITEASSSSPSSTPGFGNKS